MRSQSRWSLGFHLLASPRGCWVAIRTAGRPFATSFVLGMVAMDLEAVACREGDVWQNVAAAAAARMRGPDGFMMFRLDAAAATTLQVGCSSQAARTASPLLLHTVWHAIQVAHGPNPQL